MSKMNSQLGFLLLCFTVLGDTSADDPLETVYAFVGLPVILPCFQKFPENTEVPAVEWSKVGLDPKYVFVLQNYENYADKHKDFEFRTQLFMTNLHHGNFSMRLSDVRESDAGTYKCKTIWHKDKQDEQTVELVVGHVPTPKLSVLSSGGDAVNLSCEVRVCSLAAPRFTFVDGDGTPLTADKGEPFQDDGSGCYAVQQWVTAPTGAKSVACRVEFTEIGQSREALIVIPENTKEPCMFPMLYTGIAAGLSMFVSMGAAFLIHKCCCKSVEKKLSRQSTDDTTTGLLSPQESSTSIEIPETSSDRRPTLTAEPDIISSTPSSTVSKADSRKDSVFLAFPDATANAASTCEVNIATESAKFQQKEGGKRSKLNRQDATSAHSVMASLPDVTSQLTKGRGRVLTMKRPAMRSRSASDSYDVPLCDQTIPLRCHSVSGLTSKFRQLQEDSE